VSLMLNENGSESSPSRNAGEHRAKLIPDSHPLVYLPYLPSFDGQPETKLTERVLEICQRYTMQPRTPVCWSNGTFYAHPDTETYRWIDEHADDIARDARNVVEQCLMFEWDSVLCEYHPNDHKEDEPLPSCALRHADFNLGCDNVSTTPLPDGVDRVHVRVALLEAVVGWMLVDRFFDLKELYMTDRKKIENEESSDPYAGLGDSGSGS
jgi:hypothetical protein